MLQRAVIIFALAHSVMSFGSDTELSLYRPFAETTKHLPVSIQSTQHGICQDQSQRVIREDAWRCTSDDGTTYDPCFSKRFGSNTLVICPESPWSGKGIQLTLSQPLNETHQVSLDMSTTFPWAVELTSGDRCLSVEPKPQFAQPPVHYQCANGVVLAGSVNRCANVWTVLKYDSQGVSLSDVSRAWF